MCYCNVRCLKNFWGDNENVTSMLKKSQQVRLDQQAIQEAKQILSFDGNAAKKKERIKYITLVKEGRLGRR
jgi:hypothetical protein